MGPAQNYRALVSHVPSTLWLWVALIWNIFMSYNLQYLCFSTLIHMKEDS